jgi:hypothetical protein
VVHSWMEMPMPAVMLSFLSVCVQEREAMVMELVWPAHQCMHSSPWPVE